MMRPAWHRLRGRISGEAKMRTGLSVLLLSAALAGCSTTNIGGPRAGSPRAADPVQVTLIAFNDFHGNLEPPRRSITAPGAGAGEEVRVPAGGVAYLASAIQALKAANPNHLVLSAGDLVGASPLVSSLFLDEPTIQAMNLIGIDYNAVGNHEFDRGRAELLRLDRGGCEQHTNRRPCAVDPAFGGADFGFLAANTITEGGEPIFPAYAIRSFGSGRRRVEVAVIGLTLKNTPTVVTPEGIAGLSFRDEAETVNALIPRLKAEGADAIVVLIHQGAETKAGYNARTCEGLAGDLLPVLDRLSPEVDVVVSGHTHNAYICDYGTINPQRPFLLTSAGQYGTLLTEIRLAIDPGSGAVTAQSAENRIVQGEAYRGSAGEVPVSALYPVFAPHQEVAALVARYRAAAEPFAARVIGTMSGPALRETGRSGESVLGNLI
ncbi:MAG TPA: metallophosphoesterase, partial [Allosphingosinicella sp.]